MELRSAGRVGTPELTEQLKSNLSRGCRASFYFPSGVGTRQRDLFLLARNLVKISVAVPKHLSHLKSGKDFILACDRFNGFQSTVAWFVALDQYPDGMSSWERVMRQVCS